MVADIVVYIAPQRSFPVVIEMVLADISWPSTGASGGSSVGPEPTGPGPPLRPSVDRVSPASLSLDLDRR